MFEGILNLLSRNNNIYKSSFSDNGKYPKFCKKASENDDIFLDFRSNPVYDCIVDVINEEQGLLFYEKLINNPVFLEEIEIFKKNDLIGSPRVYNYPKVNNISPATLRYINVLYHLEDLFGNLDNKNITEIGIGYGGQARIINSKFKTHQYNLIDLAQVNLLASKYLNKFSERPNYKFHCKESLDFIETDLFLSNYAFSELKRDLQEYYFDKVIKKSSSGYMLYNHINPAEFKSFTQNELLEMIPNSKILEENPKTSEKNYIIYWNN